MQSKNPAIPTQKMAQSFSVFKTLTGFGFEFSKVWRHFWELIL